MNFFGRQNDFSGENLCRITLFLLGHKCLENKTFYVEVKIFGHQNNFLWGESPWKKK